MSYGHGARPGTGRPPQSAVTTAPVKVSYFNAKNILREELVDQEALAKANELADMAHTQLRRYYGEVLSIRRRLEHGVANREGVSEEELFSELRPEFKMLKSKAYYANKRSRSTFPDAMKVFLESHVLSVQGARDFRAFCTHFEAIVAFHRAVGKK